jgi:hypothetical protein
VPSVSSLCGCADSMKTKRPPARDLKLRMKRMGVVFVHSAEPSVALSRRR